LPANSVHRLRGSGGSLAKAFLTAAALAFTPSLQAIAAVAAPFHIGLVFLDQSVEIPELTQVPGWTEGNVRQAVRFEVERIYRSVASIDPSMTLGVNFYDGLAPTTVAGRRLNVVIGANSFVEHDYGAALMGAAFDEANHPNDSYIAAIFADNLDEVGAEPGGALDSSQKALNNLAGTIAHEIGHAFGLEHDDAGTTAPFSIMSNGATGLTFEQRLTERRFSADSATILSTALPQFQRGDFSMDGDVDVFQFDGRGDAQLLSANLGHGPWASFAQGDANSDGDVDVFQFDGRGDAQLLATALPSAASAAFRTFALAVPEPSGGALSILAGLGLLMRRRVPHLSPA
jgi:hypothetical protein